MNAFVMEYPVYKSDKDKSKHPIHVGMNTGKMCFFYLKAVTIVKCF